MLPQILVENNALPLHITMNAGLLFAANLRHLFKSLQLENKSERMTQIKNSKSKECTCLQSCKTKENRFSLLAI